MASFSIGPFPLGPRTIHPVLPSSSSASSSSSSPPLVFTRQDPPRFLSPSALEPRPVSGRFFFLSLSLRGSADRLEAVAGSAAPLWCRPSGRALVLRIGDISSVFVVVFCLFLFHFGVQMVTECIAGEGKTKGSPKSLKGAMKVIKKLKGRIGLGRFLLINFRFVAFQLNYSRRRYFNSCRVSSHCNSAYRVIITMLI